MLTPAFTADTVVLKDGEILEKPVDKADALRMLHELNDGEVCLCSAAFPQRCVIDNPANHSAKS